jgi:hypothetical protein
VEITEGAEAVEAVRGIVAESSVVKFYVRSVRVKGVRGMALLYLFRVDGF